MNNTGAIHKYACLRARAWQNKNAWSGLLITPGPARKKEFRETRYHTQLSAVQPTEAMACSKVSRVDTSVLSTCTNDSMASRGKTKMPSNTAKAVRVTLEPA